MSISDDTIEYWTNGPQSHEWVGAYTTRRIILQTEHLPFRMPPSTIAREIGRLEAAGCTKVSCQESEYNPVGMPYRYDYWGIPA